MSQLGLRVAGTICIFAAWRLYPDTYTKAEKSAKLLNPILLLTLGYYLIINSWLLSYYLISTLKHIFS